MNVAAQQYATAIMNELRGWAHEWLAALRASREQQRMLGLPAPHPNHPLPPGFPFGDFDLGRGFEWLHIYGAEQIRHVYAVAFVFHGRVNGPGSSVAWKLLADGSIELGVFEIAGAICDDAARPFAIDTDLILEAMLASLSARAPIRLASRHGVVPNAQPGAPPHAVQVYELRPPGGAVIRQVGLR
ncbi:hypothetical protein B0H17DRAFT_1212798 [Mycena rosella]|uniref:Uncharacterized protein n=1 Tax=Mycena rosella TaxID=1033263 RepID=A0AAD7G4W4_MYCRO|nr:hypothetical protein B0H17DRAFT_1212798 [Mycena rosella]